MNKEQAKNIKIGTKLININTYSVGKLMNIDNESIHCYGIHEEKKTGLYWLTNLDDWYTKEQLKEIKVTPLQAVNLLQNDIFEINDKFTINYINRNTDIIKTNDGIEIVSDGEILNSYTISSTQNCCIFKPHIKPFTKQDLKSGMIVKTGSGLEGIILFNTSIGDIIKWGNIFTPLDCYNDSLESDSHSNINKVYTLSREEDEFYNYKLLWERN